MYVIGVDPGPTTGIVALRTGDNLTLVKSVLQCDHWSVLPILEMLIQSNQGFPVTLAVERFVVNLRASRSAHAEAGRITRELVGAITARAAQPVTKTVRLVTRSAAHVKPWATDVRLDAAGLFAPTKGMPHARDAARHALFAAVADCGMRDPLNTKGGGVMYAEPLPGYAIMWWNGPYHYAAVHVGEKGWYITGRDGAEKTEHGSLRARAWSWAQLEHRYLTHASHVLIVTGTTPVARGGDR